MSEMLRSAMVMRRVSCVKQVEDKEKKSKSKAIDNELHRDYRKVATSHRNAPMTYFVT